MASPAATLYAEELKATARGRFAWIGAAVVLLAVGGLATVGTQDTWLDGYGIVAYGVVPLAFIPLAAGFIASARASRFVESVFTAPVRRGDWLAAKMLVLLTLAAGYYAALVPMMLVYAAPRPASRHSCMSFCSGRPACSSRASPSARSSACSSSDAASRRRPARAWAYCSHTPPSSRSTS